MKIIWKQKPSVGELNQRNEGTLSSYLKMRCTEVGDDYLKAELLLEKHHHQPDGIMNGGLSCLFAETVASTAAQYCLDQSKYVSVGLSLTTNHIRAISSGILTAIAKPVHLGRSTQVWSITLYNEKDQIISLTQFTTSVIEKKS